MDYQNPHVLKALDAVGGSQSELARRCGGSTRQGHVWKWLHRESLTAEAAVALERGSGGAVRRADVRPDLFGEQAPIVSQEARAA